MRKLLIWPLAFALVSCVEPVELSGDEADLTSVLSRAKVEFNPSASIVPFPNNLLLTGGTPELPRSISPLAAMSRAAHSN